MSVLWGALLLAIVPAVPRAADAGDVVRGRLTASRRQVVLEATIAPGWHLNAHRPRDRFLIPTTLELTAPAGVQAGAVDYPVPVERRLGVSGGNPVLLYDGTVRFTAPLAGEAAADSGPLRAVLRYQACDDTRCLPPRTLELTAALGEGLGGGNSVAAAIARWGYPLTFLWVALLGLALNLTPCVYPLVSVTVAFFGGRTGIDGGRAVAHALVYVLGICLAFSTLGVVAALTGSLFGAALQHPSVLGAIALLMVALALSNFGLYQVRLPAAVSTWAGRTGEGALGALFMGLTMGVVAAPCIGPIVAALLLFVGARQSVGLGFALFFVLALGMGAPYVALAAVAGRLRRLPRAGAWLVWMERLFGFVLLGLALHFATPLLPPGWERVAWACLIGSAGLVLGLVGPHGRPAVRWLKATAGVGVAALGLAGLLAAEADSPITWSTFSEDALVQQLSSRRPVFIDFQAEWCLPCREMDRTTFRDPAVVEAAGTFAMFRADVTEQDDQATELMARFGVAGVPTYVLLDPKGEVRRRLVGFVSAGDMVEAMEEVAATAAGGRG